MTRGRYRWALAVVAVSAFMITMDNSVVAIAQQTIRDDLGLSTAELRWVTIGYVVMFSCLMVAGGRLADLYGCRVTFVTGMAVFTAASAVSGLAESAPTLIGARVVQGSGAALALPALLVAITVGRDDRQRSLGQVVWLGSLACAMAGGPSVGGFIVERWHWGWIFLVNVPVGVLVIALGLAVLRGRSGRAGTPLDMPGVILSATMLFTLVYALHAGGEAGYGDPAVLAVLGIAVLAAVSFVVVERWAPNPMIDMGFFRNRVFSGGLASSMLWGIGFNGVMYYSALFMQTVLGFRPTTAALAYVPPALLVLVLTPVSFVLAGRVGARPTVAAGMLLLAGGMAAFTALRAGDGFAELMPGIALCGIGSALTMPLAMYALKAIPDERAGVAGGILSVVREVSAALGIAVLGVVIDVLERQAARSGETGAEAFRHGASVGLLVGAALVLLGAVISALTLPPRRRTPAGEAPVPVPRPERVREPVAVGAAYGGSPSSAEPGAWFVQPSGRLGGTMGGRRYRPRYTTSGPDWTTPPDPPGFADGDRFRG
ncbi:MFS transporter [Thermomonospora amylolytica]|uniref:MFS transporter n=1 Tax=Thermomonospora amylolytica TaxID=1411117 RepID=UPI001F287C2C|nr:MFS transporter [Thermomonospora amylolytica]